MYAATITKKFQICIPKSFRDDLGFKAGQQFILVIKGNNIIIMIPRREMREMRGMFKGANTENVRDRSERS